MKKVFIVCLTLLMALTGTAEEWTLITNASDLKAGDQILFACSSKGKVASTTLTGTQTKYLAGIDATFNGEELVSIPGNTAVFTLSGSEGAWVLTSQEGKALGASAAKKLAWDRGTTTWSISSDCLISSTNSEFGTIYFNDQGSARFCNYTSSQTKIQIYRSGSATPSVHISFEGFPYRRTMCELPTYKVGSTYTLPTAVPEQDNKTLKAWEFAERQYEPGDAFIVPDTDVVFVPVWDGGEGVANTEVRSSATKILRDGQLIILRDGAAYTILGGKLNDVK